MAKPKHPAYYAVPLRSRKAIVEWLCSHQSYYRNPPSTNSPLAWNVKAYGVDLNAEHLIAVYAKHVADYVWLDYPEWRLPAKAKYAEIKGNLLDWAIEAARDSVHSFDCYKSLWNGFSLDVEYGFVGRSGGWLVIWKYEGRDLTRMEKEDFREWLEEMRYTDLRHLYELVVQNDHDFRPEAVKDEIEFRAATEWIDVACDDIPKPTMTQGMLSL